MKDTAISFFISRAYKVTELHFYTIDLLFTDMGGISVVFKAVIFLLVSILLRNQWMESLVQQIIGKKEITKKKLLEIEYQMKDRISFKGLYRLHDHVNYIHKTLFSLE